MFRFGSFEIFKTRDRVTGRVGPSVGRMDILHQLLDYVTSTFYPEVRCNGYTGHSCLYPKSMYMHVFEVHTTCIAFKSG